MMAEEISKDMIRGHVDAIVLNILSQTDSYGYEIAKLIKHLSENLYELNEATLYTVFRRLEKAGKIEAYWGDESQGGRRKYYRINAAGREQLEDARKSWGFAQHVINQLITGTITEEE
jgi:DNA-binding PadR family transcriptional regulator